MGKKTAARLLTEAHALLLLAASPAAEHAGWLRLAAVVRAPDGPEPTVDDDRDTAALGELELEAVPA